MRRSINAEHSTEFVPAASDEGTLIRELQALKNRPPTIRARAMSWAMQILENTKSYRVRNSAATALVDLRADNATTAMIDLLSQPDKRGSRGALLLAIGRLRATVPLSILVKIIADEADEGKEEALDLIGRHSYRECSPGEFAEAYATIEAARLSAHGERSRALRRASEYLRIKHIEADRRFRR
jgi:HEAT repeat protein